MRILLWGAGIDGVKLSRLYRFYGKIYHDEVVGVVDGDTRKQGKFLLGQKVLDPKNILKIHWDKIIIASTRYDEEIRKRLIEEYHVQTFDILSFYEYCSQKVIRYQYESNLKKNKQRGRCENYQSFNKKSLVVYTAIIGDYDILRDPLFVDSNVHYVCYTDQRTIRSDVWEIRHVDEVSVDNRAICVREYKMLPHKFFPEYETSIWVDASIQITGSICQLIEKYQSYSNVLLLPHPLRNCVFEEVAECIATNKERKKVLLEQAREYLSQGYPVDNGLLLGGFIVRNHMLTDVISVMDDWYDEMVRYSKRDQISLPYVLWKKDFIYDLCDVSMFDNEYFITYEHKSYV